MGRLIEIIIFEIKYQQQANQKHSKDYELQLCQYSLKLTILWLSEIKQESIDIDSMNPKYIARYTPFNKKPAFGQTFYLLWCFRLYPAYYPVFTTEWKKINLNLRFVALL